MPSLDLSPNTLKKSYVPLKYRVFYKKYYEFNNELWSLLALIEEITGEHMFIQILELLRIDRPDAREHAKRLLTNAICKCADATTTATTTSTNATVIEDIKKLLIEYISSAIASLKAEILAEVKKLLANAQLVTTTANTNVTMQTQAQVSDTHVEVPDFIKDNPWVNIISNKYK